MIFFCSLLFHTSTFSFSLILISFFIVWIFNYIIIQLKCDPGPGHHCKCLLFNTHCFPYRGFVCIFCSLKLCMAYKSTSVTSFLSLLLQIGSRSIFTAAAAVVYSIHEKSRKKAHFLNQILKCGKFHRREESCFITWRCETWDKAICKTNKV